MTTHYEVSGPKWLVMEWKGTAGFDFCEVVKTCDSMDAAVTLMEELNKQVAKKELAEKLAEEMSK